MNPAARDGKQYRSEAALARAIGVNPTTVRDALNRGTLANCGNGRKRKISYEGRDYDSFVEAARQTGQKLNTIKSRIYRAQS